MYQVFADDTLIYDSTLDDYKIGKGLITREVDKSGSFVFSLYPDHFFYDQFVKLKTVTTVYKSDRIVFRGRVLKDVVDYWNNKAITCEGELGFLQDSVCRPFTFTGTPEGLFTKLIEDHNAQVDEFKQFKVGTVTVTASESMTWSVTTYSDMYSALTGATSGSALGGHIYITHGDDGTDPVPTIHYLADFTNRATQAIEFGENLKDYTKTAGAEDIATAIIPLGAVTGSGGQRLTIAEVNDGVDYVYSAAGVALYGWVFRPVEWDDVVLASVLKETGETYVERLITENTTVELTAIDLHLLDRTIESYEVCDYVRVSSAPHNYDAELLCNKQTMDLLKPDNDTIVLGYATPTLTATSNQTAASVSAMNSEMSSIKQDAQSIELRVETAEGDITKLEQTASYIEQTVQDHEGDISSLQQTASAIEQTVEEHDGDISTLKQTAGMVQISVTDADGTLETTIDASTWEAIYKSLSGNVESGFYFDFDLGRFVFDGTGVFRSPDGQTYIELDGNEMVLYATNDSGTVLDKLHIGVVSEDGVDCPYVRFGAGTGANGTAGLVKKFTNGLWLGNSVPQYMSGDFEGASGAAGFFVDISTGESYVVSGKEMKNVYTGEAIARFG